MSKLPPEPEKPQESTNFRDYALSAAKRSAASARDAEARALAYRCDGCPYAPARCVWVCTREYGCMMRGRDAHE
jgi:hypothetical protein